MGLYDVDKNSDDRSRPLPNQSDVVNSGSVKAHGTTSVNYTTDATDLTTTEGGKNGQFTIIQVGNYTTTAIYSTTAPGAGLYAADNFTIYQAPHGLNFTPSIIAYEQQSSGQYAPMPYTRYSTGSTSEALWYTYQIFTDATNVYIQLSTMTYGDASFNFQKGFIFKWYLLRQTANVST